MVVVTGGPGVADFVASLVGHGPLFFSFFFFNDTATTEIYTLSLHDALPISMGAAARGSFTGCAFCHEVKATAKDRKSTRLNSSHSQISYAVFCLKKKKPGAAGPVRRRRRSMPARCLA